MYYKGPVKLTPGVKAILSGSPDAKTTEFGDSFVNFSWETGGEKYKELENGTFVGAGRFCVEDGKVVVEYRVSKVGV
jgi:RNA polymerase I-specific transcription initiation factor RRN6